MAKLYFKYGAMTSGKSTKLLQEAYNYDRNNMKIIVAKSKVDTKGNNEIVSRIGLNRKVDVILSSSNLSELYEKITPKISCVLIDEAQFLTEKQIYQLFVITKKLDIPVMCYGLKSTFNAKLFTGSEALMVYSDEIEEIPTICSCGKKARFNARKINDRYVKDGDEIIIDNDNNIEYVPLCGECYLEKVNNCKIKRKKLNKI